jgi:hypothetical protein
LDRIEEEKCRSDTLNEGKTFSKLQWEKETKREEKLG